ncbi:hypothetical protein [Bacillus sp. FJAT-27445]|uniref:hypothetical protein n=1 Tax=Bacillus sp. FJAT-27445 TaxID=1679166 RepID=UPI000A694B66|nr:hypothetical protein [Bacillus sp. FJAT-27445]
MKRNDTKTTNNELSDEQVAENLTDLVSIINAKGDTKKIEKIIAENPTTSNDDSKLK